MSLTPTKEPNALTDFLKNHPYGRDEYIVKKVKIILGKNPELVNKTWCDEDGKWTPLLWGCYQGLNNSYRDKTSLIRLLLECGADPNVTGLAQFRQSGLSSFLPSIIGTRTIWVGDVSPLYIATCNRKTPLMELLLDAGADALHVTSNGDTALHALCMYSQGSLDYKEEVALLLKNGIDVNAQDNIGRTPLHCSLENSSPSEIERAVMTLIENGASVDIKDNRGRNALMLAALNGYIELVETLMTMKQVTQSWSADDVANIYEILGQSAPQGYRYEMLQKATMIRENECCSKEVQEPLDCYGNIEEWQTEGQLSSMRNDVALLHTQCLIAHERIFKDKPIPLQPISRYILQCYLSNDSKTSLLIQRLIQLFRRNQNYGMFFDVFVRGILSPDVVDIYRSNVMESPSILMELLLNNSEHEMVPEFLSLAIESCQRLAQSAEEAKKIVDFRNITSVFEKTAIIALCLIERLEPHIDINPYLHKLSNACNVEVMKFNYRRTLLLIYCNKKHNNFYYIFKEKDIDIEMMWLITKYSDCTVTDEFNNTPLHLLHRLDYKKAAPILRHLISVGIHYDGRNIDGHTAEDLALKRNPLLNIFMTHNRPFFSLKCQTAKVIKTKVAGYELKLPRSLNHFVAIH